MSSNINENKSIKPLEERFGIYTKDTGADSYLVEFFVRKQNWSEYKSLGLCDVTAEHMDEFTKTFDKQYGAVTPKHNKALVHAIIDLIEKHPDELIEFVKHHYQQLGE